MIIELVASAWFCFSNVICYDQSRVATTDHEVATVVRNVDGGGILVVDCAAGRHKVYAEGGVVEGPYEPDSAADFLCKKYLPAS